MSDAQSEIVRFNRGGVQKTFRKGSPKGIQKGARKRYEQISFGVAVVPPVIVCNGNFVIAPFYPCKPVDGFDQRLYATVNLPIADEVALRVTGSTSDQPLSVTNVNTGVQGNIRANFFRMVYVESINP